MPQVTLPHATIEYRDDGPTGGPELVFVHGFLVDSSLWDPVVERLRGDARCLAPTLPLGSHTTPAHPDADLTLPGLARLVADLLEALDLRDVTLVGNDSGGAICQLVVANHPERVGRLVLTDCDAFDNVPPRLFRWLVPAAKVPGAITAALAPLRFEAPRRLPLAFGWLSKRRVPRAVTDRWCLPYFRDAGVRRDVGKVLRALDRGVLLEALPRLRAFDRPVLLAWAPEDRFFPIAHARRLAAEVFPDARVEEVPDSYAFVSWDAPDRVAALLREFAAAGEAAAPAAGQAAAGAAG